MMAIDIKDIIALAENFENFENSECCPNCGSYKFERHWCAKCKQRIIERGFFEEDF